MNRFVPHKRTGLSVVDRFSGFVETVTGNQLLGILAVVSLFYAPFVLANQEGIEAFEQNDLTTATRLFKESLNTNDEDAVALLYLGKIAIAHGELDDAEDYIAEAMEMEPTNPQIQFAFANLMGTQAQNSSIFRAPGYARKSLKAFRKAAELAPETILYRRSLMEFYLQAPGIVGGDTKLAMAEAKAIRDLDEVQGIEALASVYRRTGEDDKLEALYVSAGETFPDNARISFSRGMYYQSQDKFDLAIEEFQRTQAMEAENSEDSSLFAALYQIGRSSVLGNTHLQEGIAALELFINTAPEYRDLPSGDWAKYRLGQLYARKGDKANAITVFEEARSSTRDKSLLKNLKKALKKLG